MKKILHAIINNDRPAIINAVVFMLLSMIGFLIVFSPFVLIALSENSNALEDATNAVYQHKSELYQFLDSFMTYLPFIIFGCLCEIARRGAYGRKNKVDPTKTAKELIHVDIVCVVSLALTVIIQIALLFV